MAQHIPGIPQTESWVNAAHERLINGTEIQVAHEVLGVAEDQTINYLEPVVYDDVAGGLIPATDGTPAIGIAMGAVTTVEGDVKTLSVLRAGVLNPAAIAFGPSYDTEAKKAAAFRGAPAPTNIIVKANA